jgi:hypothetical protein
LAELAAKCPNDRRISPLMDVMLMTAGINTSLAARANNGTNAVVIKYSDAVLVR